ncbi:hypothetical protein FIBSPDRAFT_809740 [Athelia psychrophila]|uniref:Uncharacterized protein n=1 Tax=Athelia psychrophila TaxID=1759441 RepID=A0A166X648_9AGAM|nr:hypothetical protein FIBSPDRAFT_809740 [Fibularhizoctonia sp. CBS 109695]
MTNGPPPSSAGPSQFPPKQRSHNASIKTYPDQYQQQQQPQIQSQISQHPPHPGHYPSNLNQNQQPWQQHQTTWQVPLAQQPQAYASRSQENFQYAPGYTLGHYAQPSASAQTSKNQNPPKGVQGVAAKEKRPASPPRPPSPPPLQFHQHWDAVIATFLTSLGMMQALRGFENDMLVINEEWEREKVPKAIGELMRDLMVRPASLGQPPNIDRQEQTLDERKLEYVHITKGIEPRTPTSINKSISSFLAQNRARNDASNRSEFLLSLAEKRAKLQPDTADVQMSDPPSCARTDARMIDRDVQMRYDIAKNEEGPLRRTVGKPPALADSKGEGKAEERHSGAGQVTSERHPALDERLTNAETHLAVRYVPSPPRSLLDRLRFLEDHIIHLEKEYPPWAALHFNQPHRGWPPPPRPTPIIVPSHLTSSAASLPAAAPLPTASQAGSSGAGNAKGKAKNPKSSLHRAVMERLEVQRARSDLAGRGGDGAG